MPNWSRSLFGQVCIALVLGIAAGFFVPEFAAQMKPLGDAFIKLIKMLIPVIVFCVVVHGIAGAGDLKKVGRVGVRAIIYFEAITTVALALGILLAYLFGPGHGMNIDVSQLDASALSTYVDRANEVSSGGTVDFLMKLIPATMISGFAQGDVLQVLLVAVLFGCALSMLGERGRPLMHMIELTGDVTFKIMGFIVRLAPFGVFGAIAFTVGKYGIGSLAQLGYLVALFYLTIALFVFGVLGFVLKMAGFNIFKLIRYLRTEVGIVAGTASSDAVLPQTMRKLEHLGIKDTTVGLVIPTGYSFNLDAFSIYLTLAAVFIAQATNTPLSTMDLLTILGVALITSKGAHGVPGSAIVILAATLTAIPAIPMIGLVLVLSVDWFMGIARALGNYLGNCVATVVVASWVGDIDKERARRVLEGEQLAPPQMAVRDDALAPSVAVRGRPTKSILHGRAQVWPWLRQIMPMIPDAIADCLPCPAMDGSRAGTRMACPALRVHPAPSRFRECPKHERTLRQESGGLIGPADLIAGVPADTAPGSRCCSGNRVIPDHGSGAPGSPPAGPLPDNRHRACVGW